MDWDKVLYPDAAQQPLEYLVEGYSHTAVFRTIGIVGDSLSSGEFETRDREGTAGYHDLYDYSWGQYLARQNGLKAYNFSRGGMTAKEYVTDFAEQNGFWEREKACQAYIIALGVNDLFNCGMALGDIGDVGTHNETFVRYYAEIVRRYQEISPDATFFFVTIPKSDDPVVEGLNPAIAKVLYDLAERFENCYVIDLYRYGPLYDARFREQYYLHGHMNPAGYLLTAKLIDSYIDYIVRRNPDQFRTVGLVNSGIEY